MYSLPEPKRLYCHNSVLYTTAPARDVPVPFTSATIPLRVKPASPPGAADRSPEMDLYRSVREYPIRDGLEHQRVVLRGDEIPNGNSKPATIRSRVGPRSNDSPASQHLSQLRQSHVYESCGESNLKTSNTHDIVQLISDQ